MGGFEAEIHNVAACCECHFHAGVLQGPEELRDAGEGLRAGEVLPLQGGGLGGVFGAGHGELGPGVEDLVGLAGVGGVRYCGGIWEERGLRPGYGFVGGGNGRFGGEGQGTHGGGGAALELGFDAPGEQGAAVGGEDGVGDEAVDVFGVDEEAVHVEEAGADGGEPKGEGLAELVGGQGEGGCGDRDREWDGQRVFGTGHRRMRVCTCTYSAFGVAIV